jgi:hypothetical protein
LVDSHVNPITNSTKGNQLLLITVIRSGVNDYRNRNDHHRRKGICRRRKRKQAGKRGHKLSRSRRQEVYRSTGSGIRASANESCTRGGSLLLESLLLECLLHLFPQFLCLMGLFLLETPHFVQSALSLLLHVPLLLPQCPPLQVLKLGLLIPEVELDSLLRRGLGHNGGRIRGVVSITGKD